MRQVEEIPRALAKPAAKDQTKNRKARAQAAKDADSLALEKRLAEALSLGLTVEGGGTLSIRYRSLDQLDDVVRRLEGKR